MIRPAQAQDNTDIARIWNHFIRETTVTFTTQEKSPDDVAALCDRQPVLVTCQNETVIGFATFGRFRVGPGYSDTAEHSIYLDQNYAQKGLGAPLLAAIENSARQQGIRILIAGIGGSNAQAVQFHAKAGYVQTGHLPEIGKKFGESQDLILMQKKL